MKINGIQIFNKGNDACSHDWVYNKPISMVFTTPAKIMQERICECCGRLERVYLEGEQVKYDENKFTATKKQFSL